jgi:DNA polymerase III, subunit gamma and tau
MTKKGYQVFARKYRPQTFADLMGQDVLVQTLKNAIENQRIPHAILLTGVRGIGKTTTARLIARALNCIGPDGQGRETITPCGVCQHCTAILDDRHLDVIEMDAASRTSVDDIRSIIETAYYKPSSARYKVQIIDEVHMLTKQAFNALLKTLEEPPEYTKFIFATTELHRIPDTIISRCVRFDLKRFERETLKDLLAKVCQAEQIAFEDGALALLAQAANGSARDSQSLLERAVGLSPEKITETAVRSMLGLTGLEDCFILFDGIMAGDPITTLNHFDHLYKNGADPDQLVSALLDLIHQITCLKVDPNSTPVTPLTTELKARTQTYAASFSMPLLMRLWQVLTKGREELRGAPSAAQGVQMVLIRACYLSELPHAQDVLQQLAAYKPTMTFPQGPVPSALPEPALDVTATEAQKKTPNFASASSLDQETSAFLPPKQPPSAPPQDRDLKAEEAKGQVSCFQEVITLCSQHKEPLLRYELENHVHLISFDPATCQMVLGVKPELAKGFPLELKNKLQDWTGQVWSIETHQAHEEDKTLRDQEREAHAQLIAAAQASPLVKTALDIFAGAEIKQVKRIT